MHNTFRIRILISMALILVMVGIGVYLMASLQASKLTDEYQRKLYIERLESIISSLNQDALKLKNTGLQEAYEASFQELALRNCEEMYWEHEVRPFILDASNNELLWNDTTRFHPDLLKRIRSHKKGGFEFADQCKDYVWVIGRNFSPWEWTIVYVVSHDEKYMQADTLGRQLALIIVTSLLSAFLVIYFTVGHLTQPISELTDASLAMADGDLNYTLPSSTAGEIGVLTKSFAQMRNAIRTQLTALEQENRERMIAEEALRQQEEDLRITLDSIGEAVITTDSAGQITRINPVAEDLTGWTAADALGKPLSVVLCLLKDFHSDEPEDDPVKAVLASEGIADHFDQSVLMAKTGERHKITTSIAPILNPSSEIVGVVITLRDITEEQAMQEQLNHSQKMDAIGQLAGGVAHDFNNMLAGILGAAEILQCSLQKADQRDLTAMIINSVKRAADLTHKLLAFGRKGRLESSPIDIHTALTGAVDILKRTVDKRIILDVAMNAPDSTIVGDLSMLQSAVINLGINASHAMPEGGKLSIETSYVDLDENYCNASPFELVVGAYIEITVSDTGSGITTEHLSHIFEPFFTTKEQGKGTGLGLAAVYGTVQQHHGAITVYSEVGRGTLFRLYFPLVDSDGQYSSTSSAKLIHGSGCILVIDDEDVIRITAKSMLESLGYQVLLAENGAQGLICYQQHKNEIDLVLMDMVMPEMDGRDCFRKLKALEPDVKVFLATGFSGREDVNEMIHNGLLGVVRKPYGTSEISRIIAQTLTVE